MARWTTAELPDLTGKRIIITGATSGIGEVTARECARAGATVVLAVRNLSKGEITAKRIGGRLEIAELDVSSLSSVRAFATAQTQNVDILINNAGIMQVPESRTAEGFELQMATNFLGPYLLTRILLPRIRERIVTLSSQLHRMARLDLTDLNWERRPYRDLRAYYDSKLADTLFGIELQRRLEAAKSPVRSVLAHPGIATTNLAAGASSSNINRFSWFLNDAERGALPTLYAATTDIPGGSYVGPNGPGGVWGFPKIGTASRAARDPKTAQTLWEAASALVALP
ncbi:SDR family NAD(P)-dependent oxidoreductase [Mycetocola spongiae]|uniref:SDR family NAD(P)-dependent oxidoreductase n=1 Tax=Mycetocola spongiae TaxID=2859226 RepID=UPI001CF1D445|nr:SDR family NAD(P)-dependent oxidoreductase [Mycetocola spongiae]UCR89423.1 SDR family NAD(P)-dependent oxidoreductase [Mycetocola spongiae]